MEEGQGMNILFLGLLYNLEEEAEHLKLSTVGLQGAAVTFQWSVIEGLLSNLIDQNLTVINALPVGVYPCQYKRALLRSKKWRFQDLENHEIGAINLPVLKQFCRQVLFIKKIKEWICESIDNRTIIAYSLYPVFNDSLRRLKKQFPQIKITYIVTDLPSVYGLLPRNKIKALFLKMYGDRILGRLAHVDSFVLLTEDMKYPLKVGNRPYTIVEGLISDGGLDSGEELLDGKSAGPIEKIVTYTGALNFESGIKILLEAFEAIKFTDYRLWICGSGEAERYIMDRVKEDFRIKFFGYLTKNETKAIQQKSTVLVNPRMNVGIYTRYSFPSKTMEYMASRKPVLMCKLDGIPVEYDNFLCYFEGDKPEDIASKIVEICEKSSAERALIGDRAYDFVMKYKNNIVQSNKILDLVKSM